MKTRTSLLLSALLFLPTGCEARTSDYLHYEAERIAFDPAVAIDESNAPYRALLEKLRSDAKLQAASGSNPPYSTVVHWGFPASHWLIATIKPEYGQFIYVPFSPAASAGATASDRTESLALCRFKIDWGSLPGGAYVPGLSWGSWAFPTTECHPPSADALKTMADWRRNASKAEYRLEFGRRSENLDASLISESWTGTPPHQPADAGSAVTKLLGRKDKLSRLIPLPIVSDQMAFAETAEGRAFLLKVENDSRNTCVVEGLGWAEVAEGIYGKRMQAAGELCEGLFEDHRRQRVEALDRDAKRLPPVLRPVSN